MNRSRLRLVVRGAVLVVQGALLWAGLDYPPEAVVGIQAGVELMLQGLVKESS